MDFVETVQLELPKIEIPKLQEAGNYTKGLVVEIAAIHEGLTANYNNYPADALEASLESWVKPYNKPLILNHDLMNEPLGRVIGAKMDKETDGSPFIRLQTAILAPEAISKVSDGRYVTGSVGGRAGKALCSVCEADWANASMFDLPCNHGRGKVYKGKLAYITMSDISWREYSFVNIPADQLSGVRTPVSTEGSGQESESEWVRAHFFSIDLNKEEVLELSESENRNILGSLRKKEASAAYHALKGGFLTALVEFETEENDMNDAPVEDVVEEEEDILSVADDLSADLEAAAEAAPEDDEEDAPDDPEAPEESTPEGQEKPHGQDIDPENSDGAPISREDTEDEGQETEEEEVEPEAPAEETELNEEEEESLEPLVEQLEAEVARLSEENARLKAAIKRGLAERVVDAKITLGLAGRDQRAALMEEHAKRSASSLADSLRDLVHMAPTKVNYDEIPAVSNESIVTDSTEIHTITEEEETEPKPAPIVVMEDLLVDTLMGRRIL